jgi:hypothetical protein
MKTTKLLPGWFCTLAVLALTFAFSTLISTTARAVSVVQIIKPTAGTNIAIGPAKTISVTVSCPQAAFIQVLLNTYDSHGAMIKSLFLKNMNLPAGITTTNLSLGNTTSPANFFGGSEFFLVVNTFATSQGGGFVSTTKSDSFFISDYPTISLAITNGTAIWRNTGEAKDFVCTYNAMPSGTVYNIAVYWAETNGPVPVNGAYFLTNTTFSTANGSTVIHTVMPEGMPVGNYTVQVSCSPTTGARNFLVGGLYVGSPNPPTQVRMKSWTQYMITDGNEAYGLSLPVGTRQLMMLCNGLPGHSYDVEYSTNNVIWNALNATPITYPTGEFYIRDTLTNGVNKSRFYRLHDVSP